MNERLRGSNPRGMPHVVIVGGGFGGLHAVRSLKKASAFVTLIDKRNFHLFQPLLYQVATGGLSPADISSPLRGVLRRQDSVQVVRSEVKGINVNGGQVLLDDSEIQYDYLVLATGSSHHYFGNELWAEHAPGLKTVEDAVAIRNHLFRVFEEAEYELDMTKRMSLLTFVIVGGGPTGVEMAGAIGELAHETIWKDFHNIDPRSSRILVLEMGDRILPSFPEGLSTKAVRSLGELGVEVRTGCRVTSIEEGVVALEYGGREEALHAGTVLWAAGVKASSLGEDLAQETTAQLDDSGRVIVEADCSLPGRPEVFVIGDLAHFAHPNGHPVPAVATAAMQQGDYVGKAIQKRIEGRATEPFRYKEKGRMAVIGRAEAVADLKKLKFSGYPAWLLWLFVHLMYLVGYENRLVVFVQWAWNYFTKNRRARLITEPCRGRDEA